MITRYENIVLLRALAVISVVLYHSNVSAFEYGFLGVDVFFVISGFLIAKILNERYLSQNKTDYVDFFVNRVLRIIPTLCVVGFLQVFVLIFYLPSRLLVENVKVLLGSIIGVSNLQLWSKTGYFSEEGYLEIFLITWSLSVELQFYLIAAIFSFLFTYFNFKKININFVFLLFIILGISSIFSFNRYPSAAFFLLPTRLFEFVAGVVVYRMSDRPTFNAVQLILIFAIFLMAQSLAGVSHTQLGRISVVLISMYVISSRRLQYIRLPWIIKSISKVSYSTYLWHYFVYAVLIFHFGEFKGYTFLLYCLISIILGFLGYKIIEEPLEAVRSKRKYHLQFYLVASGIIGLSAILLVGDFNRERDNRDMLVLEAKAERLERIGSGICHFNKQGRHTEINDFLSADACLGREADIVIFGDSHAADVAAAIRPTLAVKQFTGAGCSLLPSFNGPNRSYCSAIYESALSHISKSDTLILVNRWDKNELNQIYLEGVIKEWRNRVSNLVLILPRANVGISLLQFVLHGKPKDHADLSNVEEVLRLLNEADSSSVKYVDTNECFCEGSKCKIYDNGELLVTDADHYSTAGMKILGRCLTDKIDDLMEEKAI